MRKIKDNITFGRVGDESFIVDSEKNAIYKLNKQSSEIWKLYYDGLSKEVIIELCCKKYRCNKDIIVNDINNFFLFLEQREII